MQTHSYISQKKTLWLEQVARVLGPALCFRYCSPAFPPASPPSRTVHLDVCACGISMPPAPEASWRLILCKGWITPLGFMILSHLRSLGFSCPCDCWLNIQFLVFHRMTLSPTFISSLFCCCWHHLLQPPASRQDWLPLNLCRKQASSVL